MIGQLYWWILQIFNKKSIWICLWNLNNFWNKKEVSFKLQIIWQISIFPNVETHYLYPRINSKIVFTWSRLLNVITDCVFILFLKWGHVFTQDKYKTTLFYMSNKLNRLAGEKPTWISQTPRNKIQQRFTYRNKRCIFNSTL